MEGLPEVELLPVVQAGGTNCPTEGASAVVHWRRSLACFLATTPQAVVAKQSRNFLGSNLGPHGGDGLTLAVPQRGPWLGQLVKETTARAARGLATILFFFISYLFCSMRRQAR